MQYVQWRINTAIHNSSNGLETKGTGNPQDYSLRGGSNNRNNTLPGNHGIAIKPRLLLTVIALTLLLLINK